MCGLYRVCACAHASDARFSADQSSAACVCVYTCVRIYVCVSVYAKQQISNGNMQMMDGDVSGPADTSLATDVSVVTDVSTDSSASQDSPSEYASVEKVLGADKDEAKEEPNTTPTRERLLSSSMVSEPEEEQGAEWWSPKVDDGAKVRCTRRPYLAARVGSVSVIGEDMCVSSEKTGGCVCGPRIRQYLVAPLPYQISNACCVPKGPAILWISLP